MEIVKKKSLIIVESGATKADWAVLPDRNASVGKVLRFRTAGISAAVTEGDAVSAVMDDVTARLLDNGQHPCEMDVEIRLFAAGLAGGRETDFLGTIAGERFGSAGVFADTDLKAAAIALWGDRPGLVAILGTGSNFCLYDGRDIRCVTRPGGFVLGDEGSGAYMGRMLLADYIKGLLPEGLMSGLRAMEDMDYAGIVENLYRSPAPSRYLASFAPFVFAHADEPAAAKIIETGFGAFFERQVLPSVAAAGDCTGGIGVVGSVGWHGRGILEKVASGYGFTITECVQSPMDRLLKYYLRPSGL